MEKGKKKSSYTKEPIHLRMKELANGNKSLYLDIYQDGVRTYEYLKMYIVPERSAAARKLNKTTMMAANTIKSQRMLELAAGGMAAVKQEKVKKVRILDWLETFGKRQERRGKKDRHQISVTMEAVRQYAGTNITLEQVDRAFCEGFLDFLVNGYKPKRVEKLNMNTACNYYRVLNSAFNEAVRNDLMKSNPFTKLSSSDKLKRPESQREYMTIEEVKKLIETPLPDEDVKSAYLFSCFCGLRFSDIRGLKWKNVNLEGEQARLQIVMQKTKLPIYLPLSKQALKWIPERGNKTDEDHVFDLPSDSRVNILIKPWAKAAGINKKFTFHTARHTFATMMLTLGADLYTTSKLLGHTDIRMTQVYAKIVNKKKDEAVNMVDNIFD